MKFDLCFGYNKKRREGRRIVEDIINSCIRRINKSNLIYSTNNSIRFNSWCNKKEEERRIVELIPVYVDFTPLDEFDEIWSSPRIQQKQERKKEERGRNTSFDRTLTNVSRVVGTGVSRDRIRKVGKCDPRIKVMALRGLFPGFQGIKEPPSAEPSLPPIRLSHGPRETTPSNYRFLKPNRTSSSTHTRI